MASIIDDLLMCIDKAVSAACFLPAKDAAVAPLPSPDSGVRYVWPPDIKRLHLPLIEGGGAAWQYQYRGSVGSTRNVTPGKPPTFKLGGAMMSSGAA